VAPLRPKGLFNSILDARFPSGLETVDGFLGSHPDLNDGHPGLLENIPKGVLAIKMHLASFGPEEVQNETSKDV
jgi:hypothetical protein